MANFSKLPNELIIQIWGYVIDPDDVENFALVSKCIYGLAAPIFEGTCMSEAEVVEDQL